jgi:predicted branched-subunit amino acid permease
MISIQGLRDGHRDALGVVVAFVPFAMALGAAMTATTLPPLIAWASSPLLFGGAAQLLTVQLLGAGANVAVVIACALVLNVRMLLYSASLAPYTRAWPGRWRWAGAYLLADPVYALTLARFAGGARTEHRLAYYLGVGFTLWPAWQLITAAGLVLANVLPAAPRLELAAPLTFLLLLLPLLNSRAGYVAAVVGAAVAVAASALPLGLGFLAGAMAGTAAGAVAAGRRA